MIYLAPRSRLHIIVFILLAICTQSFAQSQEAAKFAEEFYRLYPDLKAHNEVVRTAFEQLNQSGFQAKTQADYNRVLAISAYVLLNKSSGASSSGDQSQQPKIPYWLVLEEYNRFRSEFPQFKDMSLPEFAIRSNDSTGSTAFDEGLNDSWLRRASASIDRSFINSWGFVMVLAVFGVILIVIVFRVTSRSPRSKQRDPSPIQITPEEVSHASVLGLWGKITLSDIKRSYRERMQEYHPDKVSSLGPKLREVAEAEAKKINAAYEFFTGKYGPSA